MRPINYKNIHRLVIILATCKVHSCQLAQRGQSAPNESLSFKCTSFSIIIVMINVLLKSYTVTVYCIINALHHQGFHQLKNNSFCSKINKASLCATAGRHRWKKTLAKYAPSSFYESFTLEIISHHVSCH